MLSWVHVLEWRAAVSPDAVALTDDRGGELSYAGLAAAMEREAAGHAAAGVTVVAQLPRNATGKVLRSVLREPFWAGRDRRVS